jgi:hypothetical protein
LVKFSDHAIERIAIGSRIFGVVEQTGEIPVAMIRLTVIKPPPAFLWPSVGSII